MIRVHPISSASSYRRAVSKLIALLRAKHPLPEWATFCEVPKGTGAAGYGSRRIDFIALNTWPSKGFKRVAYELKATRSDFLRELESPAKRKMAETYFHESYFAVETDVCKPEEVPEGWGLLVRTKKGDKLRRVKVPTQRKPESIPETMWIHLLRDTCEKMHHRQQPLDFEGGKITPEEVQRMVDEKAAEIARPWRARQEEAQAALQQEIKRYQNLRSALLQPFRTLAEIAKDSSFRNRVWRHSGNGLHLDVREDDDKPPVTSAMVRAWARNIQGIIAREILGKLRYAVNAMQELEACAMETIDPDDYKEGNRILSLLDIDTLDVPRDNPEEKPGTTCDGG